jgi:hypothetical protein
MIRLKLSQIGKANPADQNGRCFNVQRKDFASMADALAWLASDYGINKPARIHDGNGVFQDTEGGGSELVGFMARRWAENYPERKKYWEENWITFDQFERVPLDLRQAHK